MAKNDKKEIVEELDLESALDKASREKQATSNSLKDAVRRDDSSMFKMEPPKPEAEKKGLFSSLFGSDEEANDDMSPPPEVRNLKELSLSRPSREVRNLEELPKKETKDSEAEDAVGKVIKKALNKKSSIKPPKYTKPADPSEPVEPPLSYLQKRRDALATRKNKMLEIYQDNKDTRAWAEIAETFGQALTQWAAAKQGLRDNVDLSGIKFAKTDWVAKGDAALKELDMRMDEISKESSSIDRKEERDDSQKFTNLQRRASEKFNAEQKRLDRANQLAQTRLRTAATSGDRAERDAAKAELKETKAVGAILDKNRKHLANAVQRNQKDLEEFKTKDDGWFSNDNEEARIKAKTMIDRYRAAAGGDPEVEAYIKDTVMKDFDKNIGKRGDFSTFTGQLDKLAELSSLAASDPENARRHYKSLASKSTESPPPGDNEVVRMVDGKPAVYNSETKKFIRWQ